ncbi:MAG: hypothetical protein NTW54_07115 [Bacteroidetes bacterium]|nr:hypothetical protein [Bacteroidota bacterium]
MHFSVDNLDKVSIIKIIAPHVTHEVCVHVEEEAMALIDDKQVADIILDARKVKIFCDEASEMFQMIQLSTGHLKGIFVLILDKKEEYTKLPSLKICHSKDEAMDMVFADQMKRNLLTEEDFDFDDLEDDLEE